jgi:hypothetical protein
MIGRVILFVVVLGLIGLAVGYLIFGRVGGQYVSLQEVFQPAENILEDIGETITGIQNARRNIWISGAIGGALGVIVGAVLRRWRYD